MSQYFKIWRFYLISILGFLLKIRATHAPLWQESAGAEWWLIPQTVCKKHHHSLSRPTTDTDFINVSSGLHWYFIVVKIYFSMPFSLSKEGSWNSALEYELKEKFLCGSRKNIYLPSLFIHLHCMTASGIWGFDPCRESTDKKSWDPSSVLTQGMIVDENMSSSLC